MNGAAHMFVGELLHDRIIGALDLCCRRGEMLSIQNKRVNWRASGGDAPKWRIANARPEPDLRYFSKRTAACSVGNSIETTSAQGRCRVVWPHGPWLCT
jgi:hypothetical protein